MVDIRPENEASFEVLSGAAVITLDAPQRRNALTRELALYLESLLDRAVADPSVGALVICANGSAFCSGADLTTLRSAMDDPLEESAYTALGQIYSLFRRLVGLPIPTVAAVQGPAVGAGVNLAFACDVRILGDQAEFIGFGRARVHPGGGHLELLRSLDRQAAAWLALFNQPVSATDALGWGLGSRLVPSAILKSEAVAIAQAAACDPVLTRQVTASFRSIDGEDARHQLGVQVERAPQVWSLRRLAATR